jgi:hypothetical protein
MALLCWFYDDDGKTLHSSSQEQTISFILQDNNVQHIPVRTPSKTLFGTLSLLGTAFLAWTLFFPLGNVSSAANTQSDDVTHVHPPPITTSSSPDALLLGQKLHKLHAKMYGAYWCSHCYEQKQRLGLEVFEGTPNEPPLVPYIECDSEGYQSQRKLCKERKIPGYPTWEIDGQLFPGEMYLVELEDIVQSLVDKKNP